MLPPPAQLVLSCCFDVYGQGVTKLTTAQGQKGLHLHADRLVSLSMRRSDSVMSLHPTAEQGREGPPLSQTSPRNSLATPGDSLDAVRRSLQEEDAARRSLQEEVFPTPGLKNLERIQSDCGGGLVSHPIVLSESGSEGRTPLGWQKATPPQGDSNLGQHEGKASEDLIPGEEYFTSAHCLGAAISQEGALACDEGKAKTGAELGLRGGAGSGSDQGEVAKQPDVNFQR